MDRQQVLQWVEQKYGTLPDSPWMDDNQVIRHEENGKWFGIFMRVACRHLGLDGEGTVEVLNVKCDPLLVGSLRCQPGILPAYHMNKEKWISILLDGSVPMEQVADLIDFSRSLVAPKRKTKTQKASAVAIRDMRPEHAGEVFAMMREFYNSPAVLSTVSDDVLHRDIADCVGDCPALKGYVFCKGKQLVGYAMVTTCYTTEYGGLCVWIEDLYLKPQARHQHLAQLFFDYLHQTYPDAVRFKLEVEAENVDAIAAYHRSGYALCDYRMMTRETKQ